MNRPRPWKLRAAFGLCTRARYRLMLRARRSWCSAGTVDLSRYGSRAMAASLRQPGAGRLHADRLDAAVALVGHGRPAARARADEQGAAVVAAEHAGIGALSAQR